MPGWDREASSVTWNELTLSPLKVHARQLVSKFVAVRDRHYEDYVSDHLVYELEATVYEDPSKRVRMQHTVEVRDHATWRHALVASLPVDSHRRRFLCFLWGIALDYKGRLRVWEADFSRLMVYPKPPIPSDRLGPVVFPIMGDAYWREGDA